MSKKPQIAVIVARAQDHGIGCSDGLPWHIPEELKYFKKHTSGKPVIMGRKTFESLGKPLPNRTNIVVSKSGFKDAGAITVINLEDAIKEAQKIAEEDNQDEFFIIGGEQIFKQAIPLADKIYLTQIDMECKLRKANAWLENDFSEWSLLESKTENLYEKLSNKNVTCHFETLAQTVT